ncbi:hypothetical protein PR048_017662 [Dryococelus australis]|uniref:Uncharacterized protein n=1 Tax=Dryococelus australis TaxID=614101 RepID=A0ABQ9HA90_9NEOP|nr:hypothetical protein PR048_017662 [Dryococelus australis]
MHREEGLGREWQGIGHGLCYGPIPAFAWSDFGKPWKTTIRMAGPEIEPRSSPNASPGATVAERLASSPPTKANRAQSPAGSPDFRKWESCPTMPLVGGFSRGSPVSLAPSFRRSSIFTSITLIGSQDLAVKSRPNIFTHVGIASALHLYASTCLRDNTAHTASVAGLHGLQQQRLTEGSVRALSGSPHLVRKNRCGEGVKEAWLGVGCDGKVPPLARSRDARAIGVPLPAQPPFFSPRTRVRFWSQSANAHRYISVITYSSSVAIAIRSWYYTEGTAVAERLACSPSTKANRIQSLAGSLPDFRKWESCQTMPLVGEFSCGSSVSPHPCISALLYPHLASFHSPRGSVSELVDKKIDSVRDSVNENVDRKIEGVSELVSNKIDCVDKKIDIVEQEMKQEVRALKKEWQ